MAIGGRQLVAARSFVPNLVRAQSELRRVIEAAEQLINAVAIRENQPNRRRKESYLHGFC